ncbi:hypothetical protein LTR91_020468 [Friedmanniomyces endolithicus]|uniref:Uncharacterized protein n=1 Tax=Friedmanniomyces endolithicus TaxID=329885 RepID=A0AAN6H8L8_9PEZI|nr:hypothetical protein LTR94_015686 [Friedmanniomyces endolithicus]KAK0796245.1 hypothetical protein LTR59_007208 [Friedmanniomyces endolithicus]KAK0812388.1 hypothetical protein LTR75_004927 [Friedmanniomyces endolithicus]KAK0817542.1 hypothetical protein LTR38_001620 [Friedmanniomyces endolithicus]KAK0872824.1 hypothetical protein LTS02_001106 [Friedmanniomyces endolithicus]
MVPFFSPKRRRTTGNLKLASSLARQTSFNDDDGAPPTPGATSPRAGTPSTERPPPTTPTPRSRQRPVSQPVSSPSSTGVETDGNLYYAYARRGDNLQSRYLLTFASASTANEWWSLLQSHFPETTRPGPQLFSFKDPHDSLAKTWKHPAFAHLKSKWMYISFSDTQENGLGGAAQGIIPVQDAQGNMKAGSGLPASPEVIGEQVGREMRRETRSVRNGITKMEEHFERMMEAVERNTAQVAVLAERQYEHPQPPKSEERNGYFDTDNVTTYLGRINDMLAQHSENMEGLAKKQADTDQKLQSTLDDVASKQRNDYLDMSQLSSHLDRVQTLMESSIGERKDSAKELAEHQQRPAQIDFSPLTDRLQKVQEAVEQNSALVKALLDEGTAESKPGTPFWGRESSSQQQAPPAQQEPQTIDLSPLAEHLQKIHEAIAAQSSHMQMLVGFASGDGDTTPFGGPPAVAVPSAGPGDTAEKSLAPLGEHLEQIYNAIEEGNAYAKSVGRVNLGPLVERIEAMRVAVEAGNEKLDLTLLVEKMEATRAAIGESSKLDLTPLVEQLEATRAAVEEGGKREMDTAPLEKHLNGLSDHLGTISSASGRSNEQMGLLLMAHGELQKSVVANGQRPAPRVNLDPLIEKIEDMRAAVETTLTVDIVPLAEKFEDVIERLGTIGGSAQKGNEQMDELLQAHGRLSESIAQSKIEPVDLGPLVKKMEEVRNAVEAGPSVDLAPLLEQVVASNDHLGALSSSSEQQSEALGLLLQAQDRTSAAVKESSGASQVDLGPLVEKFDGVGEHLKSIGALSEQHNDTLQQLLQAQKGLKDAVTETSKQPDFTPLATKFDELSGHLICLREWAEYDSDHLKDLLAQQKALNKETGKTVDLAPLTGKFDILGDHLAAIRTATKEHTDSLRALLEAQESAEPVAPPQIDLAPLTDRLNRIHESLQRQFERGDNKIPSTGDAKFIMSALSSHLSKIQAVTEANAQHVKTLREKQSATQDKMHLAVASTSDAIAALNRHASTQQEKLSNAVTSSTEAIAALNKHASAQQDKLTNAVTSSSEAIAALHKHASGQQDKTDERVEALNGQVRELMGGQREMVEVVRELALSITAQNKGACDHVVVPPPRKVGRKIVGFVYDAKDGPVSGSKGEGRRGGEEVGKGL